MTDNLMSYSIYVRARGKRGQSLNRRYNDIPATNTADAMKIALDRYTEKRGTDPVITEVVFVGVGI